MGVTASVILTFMVLKQESLGHFMSHLFLEKESVLEKPYKRFCVLSFLVLGVGLQTIFADYFS